MKRITSSEFPVFLNMIHQGSFNWIHSLTLISQCIILKIVKMLTILVYFSTHINIQNEKEQYYEHLYLCRQFLPYQRFL